jgi:hypothetical protein
VLKKLFLSFLLLTTFLTEMLMANESNQKRGIQSNNQHVYLQTPKSVDSFLKIFTQGIFYNRLRSNTFNYEWEKENAEQYNHTISAIGGSSIFKSANFNDFDFTLGIYTSYAFFDIKDNNLERLKTGSDLISRYDFANENRRYMLQVGQGFVRYRGVSQTEIKLGCQLVESFYTKSNDTKMIPNAFDGWVVDSKLIEKTDIKFAFLRKQKSRSHSIEHEPLLYGDTAFTSALLPHRSANDDSAMHKGFLYAKLKAANKPTDAPLILGDISNKSVENLKIASSFYVVPELLSQIMGEVNYKIAFNGGVTVTPGVRYLKQIDIGAGEVVGAALTGNLVDESGAKGGYKEAGSLDSQMIAARIVAKYESYKINIAMTNILDEADLVTPWRAFPTGGYTRSMARYHWQANTKNYRLEVVKNGNKKGIYKELYTQASLLHTDRDESKGLFDENYYYVGFVQNLPQHLALQLRFRIGYQESKKPDGSGLDTRFEMNYIF